MFRAVNTESEAQKKLASAEAQKIKETYFTALKTLDMRPVLSIIPAHEQNRSLCRQARANLLYGYAKRTSAEALNQNIENYDLFDHKYVLFVVAEKNIAAGNFLRARKLLNLAKEKGWLCNTLYSLQKRIEEDYYSSKYIANKSLRMTPARSSYGSGLLKRVRF